MGMDAKVLHIGVDIGSTTTKILVLDKDKKQILWESYERHHAEQVPNLRKVLMRAMELFSDARLKIAFTGSGAKLLAQQLALPFVQEVIADAIALQEEYPKVGTAVELGGQDAKIIFFKEDTKGNLSVADMRMNGSCAGGTGAFLDEVASILEIPIEEYEALAARGSCVYDISGRCGVYAKTDIQPLLNQGVKKEDIALSAFHAIAMQTIGGLAQGMEMKPPVAFVGGPLSFHPTLVQVFAQRMSLKEDEVLVPDKPEFTAVYGAALSLERLFAKEQETYSIKEIIQRLDEMEQTLQADTKQGTKFFTSQEEYEEFCQRHRQPKQEVRMPARGTELKVFLGIDSGSTTTKFVLLDEREQVVDSFYAANEGEPLLVAKRALLAMWEKYKKAGVTLKFLGTASTGYGELLFSKAFHMDCHLVETAAHARAAAKWEKDVDFVLDIGGQDMKAIWLKRGIITNITVNEACSSGCGSFLENFATTLQIPAEKIAENAFASENPAVLGSRCTVFMNSSIISEQRNGKKPPDIMAGLCRSIIENVFTKVIRVSNLDSLGKKIIVQGGTFQNDAVLRALEQYLGREVIRAPYPGLMGAIGAALAAKEQWETEQKQSAFIGFEALASFSYTQESNLACPYCENHCKRMLMRFSTGGVFVTNNRCERGEIVGDITSHETKERLARFREEKKQTANLFAERERLLFADYPFEQVEGEKGITIGLPRVLSYWEMMPFWKTFWKSLGYRVVLSPNSTRQIYEDGLSAVPSDTECFPAKLVHGHIRVLEQMGVDYIFMPSITAYWSENTEKTSESMCALVKGYPIVIDNSDNPQKRSRSKLANPLFHWHSEKDRNRQLADYMRQQFGISKKSVRKAIACADQAQKSFSEALVKRGSEVIARAKREGKYAVILAARPYQNDALVNHDLPEMLNSFGVDVLTVDSVPGVRQVDLRNSRLDIVNNYHARMLSAAVLAAENDCLEYIQLVSFGCGHDAYLSDEITRMMDEISGKPPLILKVDESDIQGPLRIRVRSFLGTVQIRRRQKGKTDARKLSEPYQVKFQKKDIRERTVLVPNTSHAFCRILTAALKVQGVHAVALPVGGEKAISLGKKYVHNDICFPAQVVIGEVLEALGQEQYQGRPMAVAMGKYVGCCRLTHYSALLRKALDDAGYQDVPILTNDDVDYHRLHPGYRMNIRAALRLAVTLPMIDALEALLRKIRPYEKIAGEADQAFERAMDELIARVEKHGIYGALCGFRKAVRVMMDISYDRTKIKPRVLIVGEYLLNFHPGANHEIEKYLEKNNCEIVEAKMSDVIQKTYFYQEAQVKEYHVKKPFAQRVWLKSCNLFFDISHCVTDKIASVHPLYEPASLLKDIAKESDRVVHHTYDSGEGILIPAEILHNAKKGCNAAIILQPFGCLPNHVMGRGISKRLRELCPEMKLLSLDYDPDVSFANIENRLQMLIMNLQGAS